MTSSQSTRSTTRPAGAVFSASLALLAVTALTLSWPSPVRAQAKEQGKGTAAATEPAAPSLFEHWKVQFEAGGRNFDLYGDRPGKFFETRDIIRGVFVHSLNLRYESTDSPYLFSIKGSNIRELDETVKGDL